MHQDLGLLHLADVHEIDAQFQDVKLVIEAEPHNASGSVDISLRFQVLFGQVLEIVTANLQFEVLHVVVDQLGTDRAELVEGVLLMLRQDCDSTVLDHEAEMVERDPDYQHWNIVSYRASFQQIDSEEERVVIFCGVELPSEN